MSKVSACVHKNYNKVQKQEKIVRTRFLTLTPPKVFEDC